MGMDTRKRVRKEDAEETIENPQGALSLELLAVVAAPPLESSSDSTVEVEAVTSDSIDSEWCEHTFITSDDVDRIISGIASSKKPPRCDHAPCRTNFGRGGDESGFMVCTDCFFHLCAGVAVNGKPQGDARWHANQFQHWVAIWYKYDGSHSGYCFSCERILHLGENNGEDEGGVVVCDDAAGHASGLANGDNFGIWLPALGNTYDYMGAGVLTSLFADGVGGYATGGMPNLGHTYYMNEGGHASELANGDGYVVRGMPNLGSTCYMNALVQCLLALGKLRTRMLRPDAPSGFLGASLRDLFVETSIANYACRMWALNPRILFKAIQNWDPRFVGMQDSHDLLLSLCNCLDDEEDRNKLPARTTSIFSVRLSITSFCKSCSNKSVSAEVFRNLSASMPSKDPPSTSVVSPPGNISMSLFPAIDKSKAGNVQATAKGSDSQILGSELGEVVMDNAPKHLQVDFQNPECINSLASIEDCLLSLHFKEEELKEWCCSKIAKLQSTDRSKDGEQMASTNVNTTIDGDQTEQSDRKTCRDEQFSDLNSLTAECSSSKQPHGSDAQEQDMLDVDRSTEVTTSEMSCGEKDSASCTTAYKNAECHGLEGAVPNGLPTEKRTELLRVQDTQNASADTQSRGKQIKLDHSAHQKEENQNEQKVMIGCGIQTTVISKLPPVLTIHVERYCNDLSKRIGHICFKEILDVGPFVDSSCEDKDNSSYRLVGVVEHLGSNMASGHYVAYVRGGQDQQSDGSSSWFRANDENISQVNIEDVLRCEAYLLFYERMEE